MAADLLRPAGGGYGQIQWVKTTAPAAAPDIETDTVAISLQSSPGKQRAPSPTFEKSAVAATARRSGTAMSGARISQPGCRSLSIQGPGLAPPMPVYPLGPPDSGQVTGLTEYFAVLPREACNLAHSTLRRKVARTSPHFSPDCRLAPESISQRRWFRAQCCTGNRRSRWLGRAAIHIVGNSEDSGPLRRLRSVTFLQAPASDGGLTSPEASLTYPPGQLKSLWKCSRI